jgi:hypothetical protein
MEVKVRELLGLAIEFIALQQRLLVAWHEASPSARDLDMLLDFPKRLVICVLSDSWTATKHGLGVRFVRTDGLTVDVPFAVDKPVAFDANRLFDFLVTCSRNSFAPIPREREAFYQVFDKLCESGCATKQYDETGRTLFCIPSNELTSGNTLQ